MTENDVHTRITPAGRIERIGGAGSRRTVLNPPKSRPERTGLRYVLSILTLGKLERLARARFQIRQLTDEDLDGWVENEHTRDVLAQSVNASSEIEGEGLSVDQLPLVLAAVTDPTDDRLDRELLTRRDALRSIYKAAVWALSQDSSNFITYDFVLELHKRMFDTSRPKIAGQIKDGSIVITGAGYHIETLPSLKATEYLQVLCERTNSTLLESKEAGTASMFLTVAEFVSDFLAIHPFSDGNGRTARLLSTYLLERSGYHFARFYPIDSIILETRPRYYEALFLAQRRWYLADEDMTPWIEYYTETVFVQWLRAYQLVRDEANRRKQSGL